MSTYQQLFNTRPGRTSLISGLIAIILLYIAFLIPSAPYDTEAWYFFLYQNVDIEAENFVWSLVLVESLLLTIIYLFLVIFAGSYAELQNRLPSYGEMLFAGFIALGGALIITQLTVAQGAVQIGEGVDPIGAGFRYFNRSMRTTVFFLTLLGIILVTAYIYFTSPNEDDDRK